MAGYREPATTLWKINLDEIKDNIDEVIYTKIRNYGN